MEKLSWLCSLAAIVKRATGIFYREYPPLPIVVFEHEVDEIKKIRTKAQAIRHEAEEIERTVYQILKARQ